MCSAPSPLISGTKLSVTLDSTVEIPLELVEMDIRTLDLDFDAVERGDLALPLATHSLPTEECAKYKRERPDTGGMRDKYCATWERLRKTHTR